MAIYIYTLPKAGTYFMAALIAGLGFNDTGFHIEEHGYLNTKAHDLEKNAKTPGLAFVQRNFVPVLRALQPRDIAFGHFPLPQNYKVLGRDGRYVVCYRHPKSTLVSEFIDFRFRRTDVDWLSPQTIPDDRAAFRTYLRRHGLQAHLSIFQEIALLMQILHSPFCPGDLSEGTHVVNFDEMRADAVKVQGLAQFLGVDLTPGAANSLWGATMARETKTKAVAETIDRSALWSPKAVELYRTSGFPTAVAAIRQMGLAI